MHWIAASEKDTAAAAPEKCPWETADQFGAAVEMTPACLTLCLLQLWPKLS